MDRILVLSGQERGMRYRVMAVLVEVEVALLLFRRGAGRVLLMLLMLRRKGRGLILLQPGGARLLLVVKPPNRRVCQYLHARLPAYRMPHLLTCCLPVSMLLRLLAVLLV